MTNLELFNFTQIQNARITNVASIPQRSPFRYPGGKTWLIPIIRKWLKSFDSEQITLVDAFAGGGIVGLTAAFENLAEKKIINELGFCTILKNRIFHGGILAKGSGLIKHGDNGKGIASRWYPKTLNKRIMAMDFIKHKIKFIEGDAFKFLQGNADKRRFCYFIDPPYTIAGRRLYTCHEVNHRKLFELCSKLKGNFLMTYDDSEEIRTLAHEFGFLYKAVPMKTTHHIQKFELLISKSLNWFA